MLPRIKISLERWKFNKDYRLWVSNKGHVLDEHKQKARIRVNQKGYLTTWSEAAQKNILIHRLVLMTWRPREDINELTVDHRDHNKRNNEIENLIWMPVDENLRCEVEDRLPEKARKTVQSIRANGVTMTIEDAVTFIYALPSTSAQYSKVQVREKMLETLKSQKQKKTIFGVELEEIK